MEISKMLYEELAALGSAILNLDGQEINNPVGLRATVTPVPLSIKEQIQRLLKVELSKSAQSQGMESFEESQDFDVDNDFDQEESESEYNVMENEVPIVSPKEEIVDPEQPETTEESEKAPVEEKGAKSPVSEAEKE